MTDPDPRDKPLEKVCFTESGKVAHFTTGGYHMSATTYCGTPWYRLPVQDSEWEHVKKLPTCRRCEEILRPVAKNFKHTVTAEVTDDNVIVLYNGSKLPVLAQQAIMAEALWSRDPSGICSIEAFPYDKGEGWAKYRFRKIKDLS